MGSGKSLDYLVTGAGGQLGRAVLDAASGRGENAVGARHADLAVEDADAVASWVAEHRPRFVLHCGAWTQVDACEEDPERAQLVNGQGTANVARACAEHGVGMVYVSTDFVFDGSRQEPYRESDPTHPTSEYGRSKLAGEQAVLAADRPDFYVVRTSWVFGPGGHNFPRTMLRLGREGGPLRVVDDQLGSPSMTRDIAEALLDLASSGAEPGIYHAANEGVCSWHRFAVEILERAGMGDVEVAAISSAELDRPAPRPAYSVLDCSRLAAVRGTALPHYLDAVDRYLAEELP